MFFARSIWHALALLLLACICSSSTAAPPNVLLIVSDDQGWRDAKCLGRDEFITPNLDRLAQEGVRATSFYVTWPACTPSRGSILTGRYPQRNGLFDMVRNDLTDYGHRYTMEEYAVSPEMTLGLDPREVTIGDVLRESGYATGVVGKWDMGQAKRYLPLQRGFDFFYGHGNNGIDYYTHERYEVPSMFRGNARTQVDRGVYATDVFRREAVQFVRQNADRPWLLYLCFNAPHGASNFDKAGAQAPDRYVAMYEGKIKDDKLARYYGAVTCMDEAIGELLDTLKSLNIDRNTLVMFMSDNGGSGNGGNAPLRGSKSMMYEGGLRVPFIARWPEKIVANTSTDAFLTSLELFPTIVAAAGATRPDGVTLDGFDMLPVLQGSAKSSRQEMFWQRRSDRAARVGNYKWVESAKGGGLFDLSTDLGEKHDLSNEKPDVLNQLKAHFAAWKSEMDASEPRGPFRDY